MGGVNRPARGYRRLLPTGPQVSVVAFRVVWLRYLWNVVLIGFE